MESKNANLTRRARRCGRGLHRWSAAYKSYHGPNQKYKRKKKTKKANAKSCLLFAGVTQMVLTRIMATKSSENNWDYLKGKYEGNKKIQGMKVLNMIREFEVKNDERVWDN